MPTEYARDNLGRYQTDGLSAKDFNKVFDLIRKQQRQNRRNARRTLTPRIMGMRNRELEAFLSLGKRKMAPTLRPKIYAASTPQGRLIKQNSRARYPALPMLSWWRSPPALI